MAVVISGTTGVGLVTSDALPFLSGQVCFFAMSTAPDGFLKCNGAAVSRTTYDVLYAAIGTTYGAGDGSSTFNLPDLRGEFIRAWDDGAGVDSGRSFASSQATQNKSESISVSTSNPGNFITGSVNSSLGGSSGYIGSVSGVFSRSSSTTNHVATAGYYPSSFYRNFSISAGSHTHTATVNVSGGSESRPTNVALLACIKY